MLLFALLAADELLVECCREQALAQFVKASFAAQRGDVFAVVVDSLDVELDNGVGLHLGVCRSVLVFVISVAQVVDFPVDFSLRSSLEGNLDVNRGVIGKLESGLDLALDGEGEIFALFDEAVDLGELGLGNQNEVGFIDSHGERLVEHFVGNRGEHGFLAQVGVDDLTRHMAGTETRELVLLAEVFVGLLDASIDIGGFNGHREFGGAGFENLNVRFQLFLHLDLRSKPVLPD